MALSGPTEAAAIKFIGGKLAFARGRKTGRKYGIKKQLQTQLEPYCVDEATLYVTVVELTKSASGIANNDPEIM